MKILMGLVIFMPLMSFAGQSLENSDFLGMIDNMLSVESAELVFQDEMRGEDIYAVTFTRAKTPCTPSNQTISDCAAEKLVQTQCLFAVVDTYDFEIMPTTYECSNENLEELIGDEGLFDEY